MINLSANGIIFGAETFRQAELTVQNAIDARQLSIVDSGDRPDSDPGHHDRGHIHHAARGAQR